MNTIDTLKYFYEVACYSKIEAMHHIFFVNGNGLEWVNGELFTDCEKAEDISNIAQERKDYMNAWLPSMWEEAAEFHKKCGINREKLPVEERLKKYWETQYARRDKEVTNDFVMYPICMYAPICNIPDDITGDWLVFALEAIDWALTLKPELEDYSGNWNDTNKGNQDFLITLRKQILERFSINK